mmetsp:Transcript_37268/g.68746  ORF Transcript_37268/g.68746 Transcript_37268/m.68746 type:complete len:181 (-) Transcript_37268:244-786(-)
MVWWSVWWCMVWGAQFGLKFLTMALANTRAKKKRDIRNFPPCVEPVPLIPEPQADAGVGAGHGIPRAASASSAHTRARARARGGDFEEEEDIVAPLPEAGINEILETPRDDSATATTATTKPSDRNRERIVLNNESADSKGGAQRDMFIPIVVGVSFAGYAMVGVLGALEIIDFDEIFGR